MTLGNPNDFMALGTCTQILSKCAITIIIIQYGSTVCTVYRDQLRFGISSPKISPKNQLDIYYMTSNQDWLGKAKPKNVFRSTKNPSMKLIWNVKKFLFNKNSYWLTDWLTYLLMLLVKRNLIMAIQPWFLHCSTSLCPEMCFFANCSSSSAHIIVLSNLPLFSFVLHSFLP